MEIAFSENRNTGSMTTAALIEGEYQQLDFYGRICLWSGCIDAADHIAQGSTTSFRTSPTRTIIYPTFNFRHL